MRERGREGELGQLEPVVTILQDAHHPSKILASWYSYPLRGSRLVLIMGRILQNCVIYEAWS